MDHQSTEAGEACRLSRCTAVVTLLASSVATLSGSPAARPARLHQEEHVLMVVAEHHTAQGSQDYVLVTCDRHAHGRFMNSS